MSRSVLDVRVTPTSTITGVVGDLRTSFRNGRTRPLQWRTAQLDALAGLLVQHEQRFLDALTSDLGKPAVEAYLGEVGFVLGEIGLARAQLAQWMAPEVVPMPPEQFGPGRSEILREPYGVVLVIGPWNYPFQLVLLPLIGALAAGNTVVVKPSELAPASSEVLAELLPRYLDGVAVVQGGAEQTTALLAEQFDYIFYTGGGRVGRVVMEAAATHLTPVTLELGGKSPAIVLGDADLDVTAHRLAMGKFFNAGQTCIAPDYVLVDRTVEAELVDRLNAAITQFYGDDPYRSADYGRIVDDRHLARLAGLLASGEVVTGGIVEVPDRYVSPTILRHVAVDSPAMQDEIFGPILPIIPVDGLDAAIDFVNGRDKPLALYVFGEDPKACEEVLARTSSGGACVNGAITHITNPFLPFGGVGASGTGSYHGRATFETFSHRRSVMWRSTEVDPPTQYPPYPPLAALKHALGAPSA